MPLTPGTRLGPYEILAPLGAGGMGEVYRARDSRLGRDVAVKVLPQHLSANTEVRARFEREARTVSSLNHPHVCTLFDVGREGETDYLVMELVDGETLADRIARGPLPLPDVMRLGAQVADALDRAHRAGVVHRDLKPGNVMLTKSGAKLMDFGLARATGLAGPVGGSGITRAALTQSPTVAGPLTAEGSIVGTFQYMSPEQLEGKEADARSDVWALGCVLYEMATGRRAFDGASQASLISSIMKDDVRPLGELAPATPAALDRLVRACVTKDPDERIQSAHDVKLQLAWLGASGSQADAPAPALPRARRRLPLGWAAAVVAALLAGAALASWPRLQGGAAPTVHASILPPAGVRFASAYAAPLPFAVSPDGSTLVYCACSGEGPPMLWVRALDSGFARSLAGTEGAYSPFFSPDGHSLGFFSDTRLKRVDVAGGPVVSLCAAEDARGGTWGAGNVILFAPTGGSALFRVSADGGVPVAESKLDSTRETTHRYPLFLPDGRHYLFLARGALAGSGSKPMLWAGEVGSSKRTPVLSVASNVAFSAGHLLFVREGTLMAQPFDTGRRATNGPAVPVAEDVRWDQRFSRGVFAASPGGVLFYLTGKAASQTQLGWLDRSGHVLSRIGEPADYTYGGTPHLSPDGTRAALAVLDPERGSSYASVVDLASGRRTRLTVDDGDHPECLWTSDGRGVFANETPEKSGILRWSEAGQVVDTAVVGTGSWIWPRSTTPDGRYLLFEGKLNAAAEADRMYLVPLTGGASASRASIPFGPEGTAGPQVSPDGAWVAYQGAESGRNEVYVTTFPGAAGRWQVSQSGGLEPRWSRNGRELLYVDLQNNIVSVDVSRTASGFTAGASRVLFQFRGCGGIWRYDVSADGSRFLVTIPPEGEASPPATLVTHWTRNLRP
jgi:Tol biopolymer transport system component